MKKTTTKSVPPVAQPIVSEVAEVVPSATPTAPTAVRILKVGTCPSLSGKSKLTYHVGCTEDSEIYFRVYLNSAAGFFSDEWVSFTTIGKHLASGKSADAVTSFLLHDIFRGRSVNTPGYLFAALKNEGLVTASETVRRCYQISSPSKFLTQIEALIAKGTHLKIQEKVQKRKGQVEKSVVPVTADAAPAITPSTPSMGTGDITIAKGAKRTAKGAGRKKAMPEAAASETAES